MLKTKIQFKNNRPMININGELHPPLAYTTYFDECGEWSDFIHNGCKMFFVNVSFTDLPINNFTGFTPFRKGVFESETPDYSEFDQLVNSIISECDDALIFPRINIAMPRKWINENIYETVDTPKGGARESLFSDAFKKDGAELLKKLVEHIRCAEYSHRIAGYQLCGSTTQEWMHHDMFGSYSEMGMKKFQEWAKEKYNIININLPERADFTSGFLTDEIKKYYEFCSEKVAETVEFFAKTLKEFINDEQIVGAFYGYNCFVNDPLLGLHSLRKIINSPYIDFFSSPCCYDGNRNLGIDWGDMLPVDSIKLHGKLCFIECDIRTFLTRRMQDSRPGEYPDDSYMTHDSNGNKTVWSGPDTLELSVSAIRKAFAHQLTKASGIWWFDMWGGWYHNDEIMAEMKKMHNIYNQAEKKNITDMPCAETVLFIDEKAYANNAIGTPLRDAVNQIRVALSSTGIPFDTYMVEDAEKVLSKYKFAIFTAPIPSDTGNSAIELCNKLNIHHISSDENKRFYTTEELRDLLISHGIHCYNTDGCVIYCSGGFLGIHTVSDGEIKISLPEKYKIKSLFGIENYNCETDTIILETFKHNTIAFELCYYIN